MKPEGVIESCLYAEDLTAAENFYTRVLGLQCVTKEAGRHVFLRSGPGMVLIFNPAMTATHPSDIAGQSIPLHGTHGAGHLAFRVADKDLPAWREQLRAQSVTIESEVAWPQGGHSIYFRDPAGNSVELVTPKLWGIA